MFEPIPYYMAIFDEKITDLFLITQKLYLTRSALKLKIIIGRGLTVKSSLQEYGFDFNKEIKTEGHLSMGLLRDHIFIGNDNIALVGESGEQLALVLLKD